MIKSLLIVMLISVAIPGFGQRIDTVRAGDKLEMKYLSSGTQQYIRYILKEGKRSHVDLWTRNTWIDPTTQTLTITQEWASADPAKQKYLISKATYPTFLPLQHEMTSPAKKELFLFGAGKSNSDTDGGVGTVINLTTPAFNFETDIELFQLVPWRTNQVVILNLYQPGSIAPDWFKFKVVGIEKITLGDGQKISCYRISTDYNRPEYGTTEFWIDMRTRQFVRQISKMPNGMVLVKSIVGVKE